jgi:hypothetical protein
MLAPARELNGFPPYPPDCMERPKLLDRVYAASSEFIWATQIRVRRRGRVALS